MHWLVAYFAAFPGNNTEELIVFMVSLYISNHCLASQIYLCARLWRLHAFLLVEHNVVGRIPMLSTHHYNLKEKKKPLRVYKFIPAYRSYKLLF